jgi:hypothetical protein
MLRHETDGFTYTPTEVVLRILIAIKNPSPLAGFEPANEHFCFSVPIQLRYYI